MWPPNIFFTNSSYVHFRDLYSCKCFHLLAFWTVIAEPILLLVRFPRRRFSSKGLVWWIRWFRFAWFEGGMKWKFIVFVRLFPMTWILPCIGKLQAVDWKLETSPPRVFYFLLNINVDAAVKEGRLHRGVGQMLLAKAKPEQDTSHQTSWNKRTYLKPIQFAKDAGFCDPHAECRRGLWLRRGLDKNAN